MVLEFHYYVFCDRIRVGPCKMVDGMKRRLWIISTLILAACSGFEVDEIDDRIQKIQPATECGQFPCDENVPKECVQFCEAFNAL